MRVTSFATAHESRAARTAATRVDIGRAIVLSLLLVASASPSWATDSDDGPGKSSGSDAPRPTVITGPGVLTLSGKAPYPGPIFVDGGTLQVSGSFLSTIIVQSRGTLAGSGTVGDVTVKSSGILAPGSLAAIGTTNVSGSLLVEPGATYAVRASPLASETMAKFKYIAPNWN